MGKYLNLLKKKQIYVCLVAYVFIVNYLQIFEYRNIASLGFFLSIFNLTVLVSWIRIEGIDFFKSITIKNNKWIEVVLWILIISIDLSKIYHGKYNFVVIPFILFGKILPNYVNCLNYPQVFYINLIGTLPFIIHPLYGTLKYSPYYNNSVGILLTIVVYFILIVLVEGLNKKNKIKSLISLLYLLINIIMIYLTGSRTAIMTTFFLISYFFYHLTKDRIRSLTVQKVIIIIIGFILILYLNRDLIIYIYQTIFLKWDTGNSEFDFTFTGRTNIWYKTIKKASFFGGGPSFFKNITGLMHGHNIIFNILGFYGFIPFMAFIVIIIYLFYLFINVDHFHVRLFILLFLFINTFEGTIANYKHSYFEYLSFFYLGLLMIQLKKHSYSKLDNYKGSILKNYYDKSIYHYKIEENYESKNNRPKEGGV